MKSKGIIALLLVIIGCLLIYIGITSNHSNSKHILATNTPQVKAQNTQVSTKSPTQKPTNKPTAKPTIMSSTKTSSSYSSQRSSFTNKYGTPTTKCAYPGCSNYIASSGDTNCCTLHSNRCLECHKYIDGDAAYCMDCLTSAINKIKQGK